MKDNALLARMSPRQFLLVLRPFFGLAFILLVFCLYDLFDFVFQNAPAFELERFPRIFTIYNLKLVGAQTTIIAVGGLGMTMVIISGGIDLSPGSVIALITVVVAMVLKGLEVSAPGVAPYVALLAGLSVGLFAGFLNGLMITRLSVVPFIATLGMMSVARGTAKLISGEQNINAPETWLNSLLYVDPAGPVWALPYGFLLLLALAVLLALVLRFSVFGRYVFAVGSNEATARLCGIRVERQKVLIYTLAGLFVGIAAVMEFSTLSIGNPSAAVGKELEIIAAVVIGGGSLSGGKGSVLGTLIGAFIIGILRNGFVLYDLPNPLQEIAMGIIIVAAVAIDQLQQRRGQSFISH